MNTMEMVKVEKLRRNEVIVDKRKEMIAVIDEIHKTFYSEVDRIIIGAQQLDSMETTKQSLILKRDRLVAQGFRNTDEVKEADTEIARIADIQKANARKENILNAINHFSMNYPNYKFITKESVENICKKYNLIYGAVSKYKGVVPDVNLKHIEDFKIKEEDAFYLKRTDLGLSFMGRSNTQPSSYNALVEQEEQAKRRLEAGIYHHLLLHEHIFKAPLEICAPKGDFDTTNMELDGFELKDIEILDPIVLAPVLYGDEKFYLIVTAWGIEAYDQHVINHKMN